MDGYGLVGVGQEKGGLMSVECDLRAMWVCLIGCVVGVFLAWTDRPWLVPIGVILGIVCAFFIAIRAGRLLSGRY